MGKNKITSNNDNNPKRNEYVFSIDTQRQILISSNFENGNISLVKQVNELHYILEALNDVDNVASKKCWFHFKIKSQKGIKVRLVIQNVSIYDNIFEDKLYCKPMMKENGSENWQQVTQAFFSYRDQLQLIIDHTFKNSQEAYFCLSVPFTYSQNQLYLEKIKIGVHGNIDYKDEILTYTPRGNNVHILTITQNRHQQTKKKYIRSEQTKPVILITSRVHPGQVSASYCFQGILQFLLSYHNLQAYLLRRLFIFKIIPMLNPDGVIEGNYRADPQGFNLNRFYLDPNKQQQPVIFQIQRLMKRLSAKQKIQFYFDLHSHSSIKQSFIYGNAHDQIVNQTYSQLFCKVLQENFPRFRYGLSNFGEEHMKHKDRGQSLTKQGCGRVAISKLCGVICSYTMQSSIFPAAYSPYINKSCKSIEKNIDFEISYSNYYTFGYQKSEREQIKNQNILIAQNKRLGGAMMISVLDMLEKNPYTRLRQGFLVNFYKDVANKLLQNEQRFKMMDIKSNQKARMILQQIKNRFDDVIDREWNIIGLSNQLNQYSWPSEFRKISIINDIIISKTNSNKSSFKKTRFKTETKERIQNLTSTTKPQNNTTKDAIQKDDPLFESNRAIYLNQLKTAKPFLPQIKFSVQMKNNNIKGSLLSKSKSIKQGNLRNTEQSQMPKLVMFDYINEEIAKINLDKPQKQMLKHKNSSLNRLIATKILEKQRNRSRNSDNKQIDFLVESRKRIITEVVEDIEKQQSAQIKHRQKLSINQDDLRVSDLKKTDLIKKRMFLTNKAIELFKKNDRNKFRLPEVNKINLVIENSRKDIKKDKNTVQQERCASQ